MGSAGHAARYPPPHPTPGIAVPCHTRRFYDPDTDLDLHLSYDRSALRPLRAKDEPLEEDSGARTVRMRKPSAKARQHAETEEAAWDEYGDQDAVEEPRVHEPRQVQSGRGQPLPVPPEPPGGRFVPIPEV